MTKSRKTACIGLVPLWKMAVIGRLKEPRTNRLRNMLAMLAGPIAEF